MNGASFPSLFSNRRGLFGIIGLNNHLVRLEINDSERNRGTTCEHKRA